MGDKRLVRAATIAAAALVALLGTGTVASAEVRLAAPAQQQVEVTDFSALQGSTIARGTNSQPVGILGLKSYRVEELALARPVQATVNGQDVTVDRAIRLIITGGPFEVRDIPATIWIDDTAVGYGQESADLSEISVVLFDTSAVRDGAALAVSYVSDTDRTVLPERLAGLRRS